MRAEMRRVAVGIGVALLAAAALAWYWLRPPAEKAHVRERSVTVWSRLAQVRQRVADLRYGQVVSVLERRNSHVRIRSLQGAVGWVEERQLMEPELWERTVALHQRARALPVQARGRTRVASNLRVDAGRTAPLVFHLSAGMPVEVVARGVAEVSLGTEQDSARGGSAPPSKDPQGRLEDWLLVRADAREAGEVAGWVLARFVEPDLPPPLRDLGAGIRFLASFELNRVSDVEGPKPQYLGVGVIGREGQPCDFTLLRVYTWHRKRRRYETGYVESNFCGRLPVRVKRLPGQATFRFMAQRKRGQVQREYRVQDGVVLRLRTPSS